MKKVLALLSVPLCLALVVPAFAQSDRPSQGPEVNRSEFKGGPGRSIEGRKNDPFSDVDPERYRDVYQFLESLRVKGILNGYPDGMFRGGRTLTRWELAYALERAIQWVLHNTQVDLSPINSRIDQQDQRIGALEGRVNDLGNRVDGLANDVNGLRGRLDAIDPKLAQYAQDIQKLYEYARRFEPLIAQMGTDINMLKAKVDDLTKRVGDLEKRPKLFGGAFFGIRSDRAHGGYVDFDGRVYGVGNQTGSGLVNTPLVLHQFQLGVTTPIDNKAEFSGDLIFGNYKQALGSFAQIGPFNTNPAGETYVNTLTITAPLGALGRGGGIVLGRYKLQATPLTLWKPDVDRGFYNPMVDDGMYRVDGVKITTSFGSVGFTAFGGQTKSVQDVAGNPINSPLAGASGAFGSPGDNNVAVPAPAILAGGNKPIGQPYLGQMVVDQLAGIQLSLPVRQFGGGHVRFTAIDTSAERGVNAGLGFTNVLILGSDFDVRLSDNLTLSGEWAKTITGDGRHRTVNPYENNAFSGSLGYTSGNLMVKAGYKYVDPLFYAPGYWGCVGNWLNPTNVQGPNVALSYNFNENFGVKASGEFLTGARNRGLLNLTSDDDITRVLAGIRWNIAKNFQTTVDWEGVYWSLDNTRFDGTGKVHPFEQYITLGTGYNLTDNTLLRLNYRIGNFDGKNALGGGANLLRYNFNTFTSSVVVKF